MINFFAGLLIDDEGSFNRYQTELIKSIAGNGSEEVIKAREYFDDPNLNPDVKNRITLCYIQLRSSIIKTVNLDINEVRAVGALCFKLAVDSVKLELKFQQKPSIPIWLKTAKKDFNKTINKKEKALRGVEINFINEPTFKLIARNNTINVYGFTREFLVAFNAAAIFCISCNSDMEMYSTGEILSETSDLFVKLVLPYFMFLNDEIPMSKLPDIAYKNLDDALLVIELTKIQMFFLISHELGHNYYRHEESPFMNREEYLKKELEADDFALNKLKARFEKINSDIIKTSLILLFKFIELENLVSNRNRKNNVKELVERKLNVFGKLDFTGSESIIYNDVSSIIDKSEYKISKISPEKINDMYDNLAYHSVLHSWR
ncbi:MULTISPECIES: ImmA/IrrE family metallo-endopeptidase [Vibrio]|uniref:ImmA/IrrE family metallo-endopeptidase n=1 Tax=Vibrio TaxID=662 RepID=UPI0014829899|nr:MULTISPECIES: hypothetical protein [Vibrio]MBS9807246.1 hypothetical protein [Vibrio alginolyticus]MCZ2800505.1 hypothetical protein [Vibrio alginolyticus]MDW3056997.1 hypothetical protein [Vibrio sp. 1978]NNN66532.1 hypothetical protein [Vibrio sp. 2-1(7)]